MTMVRSKRHGNDVKELQLAKKETGNSLSTKKKKFMITMYCKLVKNEYGGVNRSLSLIFKAKA